MAEKEKNTKYKKTPVISGQKATTRTDISQLPVAHAHTQGNPEGVTRPLVTSGSHVACTTIVRRKKRGENPGMRRTYLRDVIFGDVTSGSFTTSNVALSVPIYY